VGLRLGVHADELAYDRQPKQKVGIEKQLSAIEGVASVETEIRSGTVVITMAEGSDLDEAAARKAVEAAGFTMRSFKREENAE
jgi:copper chaperone CopZ